MPLKPKSVVSWLSRPAQRLNCSQCNPTSPFLSKSYRLPHGRSLLSLLPHARIYAGPLGPCLGKLAYKSHVVWWVNGSVTGAPAPASPPRPLVLRYVRQHQDELRVRRFRTASMPMTCAKPASGSEARALRAEQALKSASVVLVRDVSVPAWAETIGPWIRIC